jgi:hypothetical protein
MPYEPRSGLRRSSRRPWIIGAVVAVVAAAAALVLWRWWSASPPPAAPPPPAPAAEQDAGVAAAPPPEPADARSLLEAISPDPLVRRGLTEGDVLRRWAVVTDNLAEGTSPRKQLGFLAPTRQFSVVARRDGPVIAPESYQRYEGLADAIAAIDPAAVARAYRVLRGPAEAAYRALGYPNASLDRVTARALRRIASAPVREGDVPLEPRGRVYAFADPKLEDQPEVEKHLLRMGPRNTRLLQAKARALLDALGLGEGGAR